MDLGSILSSFEKVRVTYAGVEERLLKRKVRGTLGLWIGGAAAVVQLALALTEVSKSAEEKGLGAFLKRLFFPEKPADWILLLLVAGGVLAWFVLRRTGLLLREVKEPFRYTFWIAPFEDVRKGAGGGADPAATFREQVSARLLMLHFDIRDRLDRRVRRFSLLSDAPGEGTTGGSHIHVEGHWELRLEDDRRWFLFVLPSVRIGGQGAPATLAVPVKYLVHIGPVAPAMESPAELDPREYQQLVERVYSSVATEVYKQIDADVREKVGLFPTGYLRALALLYEAEDFARSNTVDAYNRAIGLYREALRWFELSMVRALSAGAYRQADPAGIWLPALFAVGFEALVLIRGPRAGFGPAGTLAAAVAAVIVGLGLGGLVARLVTRWEARNARTEARLHVGHAKCLVFRRYVSALSGRPSNPLFQVLPQLERVRRQLDELHGRIAGPRGQGDVEWYLAWLTFPPDTVWRRLTAGPSEAMFADNQAVRFEAYTVSALAYATIGAMRRGEDLLRLARAIDPRQSERSALFGLAAATLEPRLQQRLVLLRLATEAERDFQIAQFSLAYHRELAFRLRAELRPEVAQGVLEEYDEVLSINPGNVAALAAKGYIEWLVGRLPAARQWFDEGCDVKAVVRETFVGALWYGLARVAAEQGDILEAFQKYGQAISADPAIASASSSISYAQPTAYYELITSRTFDRYRAFRGSVVANLRKQRRTLSTSVFRAVHSFALNDFACACLNLYYRLGDRRHLELGNRILRKAVAKNPRNAVAWYNLHESIRWLSQPVSVEELDRVAAALPTWPRPLLALAYSGQVLQGTIRELEREIADLEIEDQRLRAEEQRARERQERERREQERLREQQERQRREQERQQRDVLPAGEGDETRQEALEEDLRLRPAFAARATAVRARGARLTPLSGITGEQPLPGPAEGSIDGPGDRPPLADPAGEAPRPESEALQDRRRRLASASVDLANATRIAGDRLADFANKSPVLTVLLSRGAADFIEASAANLDRIEEFDVEVVRAYAHVRRAEGRPEEAAALFRHVLRVFAPESFDDASMLQETVAELKAKVGDRAAEAFAADLEECCRTRWSAVMTTLEGDPAHVNVLANWFRDFAIEQRKGEFPRSLALSGGDERGAIRRAMLAAESPAHRRNLAAPYLRDAETALREGQPEEADRIYGLLDGLARAELDWSRARGRNMRGNRLYADGRLNDALAEYETAIAVLTPYLARLPAEATTDLAIYCRNLAVVFENRPHGEDLAGDLRRAVDLFARAEELDPSDPEYATRRERLSRRLALLPVLGDARMDMMLVVAPVGVEVSDDMVAAFLLPERRHTPQLDTALEAVRERLWSACGIRFPSVRFRANEGDLTPGSYVVSLNEIPLILGQVPQGEDPLAAVCRHLEEVLFAWRVDFLGHQEVANMIGEVLPAAAPRLAAEPGRLSGLTATLRALASEGVPLSRFETLVEAFERRWVPGAAPSALVEALRWAVREALPGNEPEDHSYLRWGPTLDRQIRESVHVDGGEPVLAMEPEPCQEMLALLRARLADHPNPVIVTSPDIRAFVRELTRLEFPGIPVLAEGEVIPPLYSSPVEILEAAAA